MTTDFYPTVANNTVYFPTNDYTIKKDTTYTTSPYQLNAGAVYSWPSPPSFNPSLIFTPLDDRGKGEYEKVILDLLSGEDNDFLVAKRKWEKYFGL